MTDNNRSPIRSPLKKLLSTTSEQSITKYLRPSQFSI